MISIIIASVSPELLDKVQSNIADTIGIDFEIIAIENSDGARGICELYNDGASQAKFEFLCFMHEDVLIHTYDWGKILIDIFKQHPKLGLIGIAGSQHKSAAPSSWYCYENEAPELLNFNILQRYKYVNKEKQKLYSNPQGLKFINVASVDGVWMCCTKNAFTHYHFDEKLLKKFHGYDLDFSLGIGEHFEIGVTFDILVEHFSEGYTDKTWLEKILKVHAKWYYKLPVTTLHLSENKIKFLEKRGFRSIMGRMRNEGFKFGEIESMLLQSKKSRIMNSKLFLKLYLHLIKIFLKKAKPIH